MPLFIDGILITKDEKLHAESILESFLKLKERSSKFMLDIGSRKVHLTKDDRTLYVCQREYATISKHHNKQNFKFIASDDATTCHIIVLKESSSKSVSFAHFDGGNTKEGLYGMLDELRKISDCPSLVVELFIFGGFIDKKKYSEKIFSDLLSVCINVQDTIHLNLACVYSLNNTLVDGQSCPIIYGIAVNIETSELLVASSTYRGPDVVLREVRLMYSDISPMVGIYDFNESIVYIEPFTFHSHQYANQLLMLPDSKYLQLMSTSPHCEPTNFVKSSKNAIIFTLNFNNRIDELFCSKRRNYILDENGEWILQDHKQLKLF
ncbi:protein N-terminal asparagine amidohydrolase-like [Hydractinia symbiolongicarpus]|uniref:protein N-terminal asparagine amidohydrolase-like n=1 Tax=Hydractinia symbiolongicarpus TaxID=13093 RepID=UPI00254F449E|nr:protein N-terminal asparagine amidohydrolase-like [Hydractinia symbiolongicarpus]